MPKRTQLSRKAGYRLPPNTKKVDRTTPWGNPFRVISASSSSSPAAPKSDEGGSSPAAPKSDAGGNSEFRTPQSAVDRFRTHLAAPSSRPLVQRALRELRNFDLACWCGLDQPCHADVWLEIVNA